MKKHLKFKTFRYYFVKSSLKPAVNEVFKRDAFVVKENNQKLMIMVENQFVIEEL